MCLFDALQYALNDVPWLRDWGMNHEFGSVRSGWIVAFVAGFWLGGMGDGFDLG